MVVKSGIYCIFHIPSEREYIGSSRDIKKRVRRHFAELKENSHKNRKLQYSYNKKKDEFSYGILELVSDHSLLIEREQYYIDSRSPYYNIHKIANSAIGVNRTKETRNKIRMANLGLKHPQWRRDLKSKAQGGDNHWTKKKKFSEQAKRNMSEAQKRLYKNGYKHPNRKPVYQLDMDGVLIKRWDSISDAGKAFNINPCAISHCANGKSKHSGGYKWKF